MLLYTSLQIIILLGRTNIWSDIYQFFSDNGQSKIFHIVFLNNTLFFPGHVSPQCNASKTECISASPNASINNSSGYTQL